MNMHNNRNLLLAFGLALLMIIVLTACKSQEDTRAVEESSRLEIVVTTTFIGDVMEQIAGEIPQITVLLEPGQNPHSYQPTPQDMVKISRADAIFVNGLDLEEFLDDLLDGSDTKAKLIVVSDGIKPLGMPEREDQEESDQEDEGHSHELGYDPHVWFDPNNVITWVDNIVAALSELDSDHAADYQANGQAYIEELIALDSWIREEVSWIPEENRELVTDHTSLGYFAEEYGFLQIGAVIPALTTEAETSGQELAGLIDTIRANQVKAIFIGIDFDPTLAQRVAEETGVDLIPLYFGSLSDGEPAGTYLDFMRYDVTAVVSALE
ncbi:MAG: metal ABC transporter substrate-binding protein [Anaerolineales bacterium]